MRGVIAITLAALVVTTACGSGTSGVSGASPTASRIAWTKCDTHFECGSVTVPLDYSHPNAGTISIALERAPALIQAQRIGSLLVNWGGPGDSGINSLRSDQFLASLNFRFDLIGFDPRGVGQSAPVHCLTAQRQDALNSLDPVLDDPQEKQAAVSAYKAFAASCQQASAAELPFLDTASTARDMDVIRAALGEAKLTYLGFSYGTLLGETYAQMFPTHVRALALDAVIDPNVSGNDMALARAAGVERSYQALLSDCKARTTCALGRQGDPVTKLTALLNGLDTNPLRVGDQLLTRGLAIQALLIAVYFPGAWNNLDQALASADSGDGTLLLQMANSAIGRDPGGYSTNQMEAAAATLCLDQPLPSDIAAYDQLSAAFTQASPLWGPIFQYSNLICAYWPVSASRRPGLLTAAGAPPILLVAGTDDPVTPYVWAQSVNKQLAGSVLLTRQGYGHMSRFQSGCVQRAEDSYLLDLKLPAPGTVCKNS